MAGETDYGFIISLDTQGSGELTDPERPGMRDRIYEVAEVAFAQAGIAEARLFQEDRGDGILAVLEPRRTERVAGEWVEHLHQNLRKVNTTLKRPLRLRAGLNIGPVTPDGHGFSGAAVDFACRIGNCPEARRVLAAAPGSPLLVAVSDRLYQDVVRHGGRWIEPGHYRQYDVRLREGPQRPWFMVPGRSAPPLPGEGDAYASGDADAPQGAGGRRSTTEDGDLNGGPSGDPSGDPSGSPGGGPSGDPGGDPSGDPGGRFHFGPVTNHGQGQVLQGEFGSITFDQRKGGGA
jgi:hypothetical protein